MTLQSSYRDHATRAHQKFLSTGHSFHEKPLTSACQPAPPNVPSAALSAALRASANGSPREKTNYEIVAASTRMPGPIVLETATRRTYWPFDVAGLALIKASNKAFRLLDRLATSNDARPIVL